MKSTLVFLHPHFLKRTGASKVVLEQASRLQSKKIKCQIFTTTFDPEIVNEYPNLKIIALSNLSTGNMFFWLTLPIFLNKLFKVLKNISPKIIYCHSLAIYWGFIYKLLYPKSCLIIYFHDLGFPYFDSTLETNGLPLIPRLIAKTIKPLATIINKNIIKISNYLIANSETTANFILGNYYRQVDLIVTPGVNLNQFSPQNTKKDYLITVGRLEKIKNIETTIRAFVKFKTENPQSKLNLKIVGQGPYKDNLKKIATADVQFIDNQNPTSLATIYSQAKAGIFMSPAESFGLTAIECLSCGTPIIGVNQNGIKEIVTKFDTNFLVNNSVSSLSQKIFQVTSFDLNKNNLEKARNSVLEYSWENQITKFTKWLNKL